MYKIVLTKQAVKDTKKLERSGLKDKASELLRIIRKNPYQNPPEYEKLKGFVADTYSRRINKQHRLVYEVLPSVDELQDEGEERLDGVIKVVRMWTHYE